MIMRLDETAVARHQADASGSPAPRDIRWDRTLRVVSFLLVTALLGLAFVLVWGEILG